MTEIDISDLDPNATRYVTDEETHWYIEPDGRVDFSLMVSGEEGASSAAAQFTMHAHNTPIEADIEALVAEVERLSKS